MPLPAPPAFAQMLGAPAWQRAAFDAHTALVGGVVQLAWDTQGEGGTARPVADTAGAGLAFDNACRLYHSVPAEGRVERWLWGAFDPARPQAAVPLADVLTEGQPQPQVVGALETPADGFVPKTALPGSFTPRALATDAQDHLFVLDTQGHQVWVLDLPQRRVLRAEPVAADAVAIAWHAPWLWVLSHSGSIARMSATRGLQPAGVHALPSSSRLAFAADGRLYVLVRAHAADALLVLLGRPGHWLAAPAPLLFPDPQTFAFASDLTVAGRAAQPTLVVARRPEDVLTVVDIAAPWPHPLAEPLTARHYDGNGIATTPDGRVVFWTAKGARHATAARLHYHGSGRVVGFRLDAGQAQARWGRIFLDACLPAHTALRVHAIVSDDEIEAERVPRTPPANQAPAPIADADATPLPLQLALPADDDGGRQVFRRSDGSEQPWLVESERFDTYETVAPAEAGRYLWLVIDLQGHSRATPRLRGVRAETPAHDWLRRLPQLYARDAAMRSFLQRYLAPLAGLEDDLIAQADGRHALLKPCSTPAAVLPWLAHWVGLVLDERWSETARRSFIREAPWLFRLRGTVWALRRMLEIVTAARVVIVEQFRLRGLGRLGPDPSGEGWDEPAVLGAGFRVGGPLGTNEVTGDSAEVADSFERNAHRFTVLVQAELDTDTDAAVRHLLDVHRPAHTLFTLCSLGAGARIGRGLQLELTSVVGPSGGFRPLQLDAGTLGRGQVLGRPGHGVRPGSARVGVAGTRLG